MTKRLIATYTLRDYCQNLSTLDVRVDECGELTYSLYGKSTRIPFSLHNLYLKTDLPRHTTVFESAQSLADAVRAALETSSEKPVDCAWYSLPLRDTPWRSAGAPILGLPANDEGS